MRSVKADAELRAAEERAALSVRVATQSIEQVQFKGEPQAVEVFAVEVPVS